MQINVYGCLFSLGGMISYQLFKHLTFNKINMSINDFNYIFIILVIVCIFGGRLMKYMKGYFSFERFPQIYKGGLVSYGALYMGLLYLWLIARIYNVDKLLLIEAAAVSSSLQHIMIRAGNYFNNELKGKYTDFLNRRYPIHLQRIITEGFIMGSIAWWYIDTIGEGYIYLIYANLYPLVRIFNEIFTEDDNVMPIWYKKYFYKYISYPNFQAVCLCLVSNLFYLVLI